LSEWLTDPGCFLLAENNALPFVRPAPVLTTLLPVFFKDAAV